ncbi:MAG: hypothetical protein K2X27_22840 [Candidatus Obscuribacterales bacterium]|nr:hypothetical protein [Candidatus Obscuribacterales bacterium]
MNNQNQVRQEAAAIRSRIETLVARLQAGQLIRQSLETSTALSTLERIGRAVDDHEARHTSEGGAYQIPAIFPVAAHSIVDPCGQGTNPSFAALSAELDAFKLPVVRGLAHDEKSVTHYCVTASKEHGHGVFSAHDNKDDARFNAALTGGKCCAVDRNEDGRIIKPHALREAERIASEYC